MNKYTRNSSKGCVPKVDLECPKELWELQNVYTLAPDKIETKREVLSHYQQKIADLCNIPIGNVTKLVLKIFDKEKYVLHHQNLQLYLRLRLIVKKIHGILEFNQSEWFKPYLEFITQKRMEALKK